MAEKSSEELHEEAEDAQGVSKASGEKAEALEEAAEATEEAEDAQEEAEKD